MKGSWITAGYVIRLQ